MAETPSTTRDQAYGQYQDIYKKAGLQQLRPEEENDFNGWWNNAAESGAYQGPGYGTPWASLTGDIEKRAANRFQDSGNTSPDSNPFPTTGGTPAGGGTTTAMGQWTGGATSDPAMSTRRTELYDTLMGRARQGLEVSRTDPAVRGQADAYAANEERARRNYLGDTAEREGPYVNMQGEQRMTAERMGQRTGAFEAELMGREIMAKRQEISEALAQAGNLLSDGERLELQRQLTLLDNALRQQGLDSQNDQFAANLGLQYADRSAYYDLARRGLL